MADPVHFVCNHLQCTCISYHKSFLTKLCTFIHSSSSTRMTIWLFLLDLQYFQQLQSFFLQLAAYAVERQEIEPKKDIFKDW